jgi:hypothetical protein
MKKHTGEIADQEVGDTRYAKLQSKKEEVGQIADQEEGDRPNCRPRRRRLAKLQTKKEEISQRPKKEN